MKKTKLKPHILKTSYPVTSILICGVGGQGIILASDILCHAALLEGFDVKKSEVHGMAQRGGSVVTHVRFGTLVHSPLIEKGTADFILAFERLEALRYAHYLKKNGTFVINTLELPPAGVLLGTARYPEVMKEIEKLGSVNLINASKIAEELGNARTANVVLLGGLAKYLNFEGTAWEKAIKENTSEKFHDINLVALKKGMTS